MRNQLSSIKYMGDPLLMPITSHENTFLVRLFHKLSTALNDNFEEQIMSMWNRQDMVGKLSRQILYPPIEIQYFDKMTGVCHLKRQQLNPRISLRPLGSNITVFMVILSLLIGHLFWRAPVFGLFLFSFFVFSFIFLKAIFS